jgi:hypothetical protein
VPISALGHLVTLSSYTHWRVQVITTLRKLDDFQQRTFLKVATLRDRPRLSWDPNLRHLICMMALTISPPAVKTQCLFACHAFWRLVRSSPTKSIEILITFDDWSTESICNRCYAGIVSKQVQTIPQLCAKELGQTSQSLCCTLSGRQKAALAVCLAVAYWRSD